MIRYHFIWNCVFLFGQADMVRVVGVFAFYGQTIFQRGALWHF